ncbi:MAG: hypothetical protein DMG68_06065, partial [Acidobacteria bacterium]
MERWDKGHTRDRGGDSRLLLAFQRRLLRLAWRLDLWPPLYGCWRGDPLHRAGAHVEPRWTKFEMAFGGPGNLGICPVLNGSRHYGPTSPELSDPRDAIDFAFLLARSAFSQPCLHADAGGSQPNANSFQFGRSARPAGTHQPDSPVVVLVLNGSGMGSEYEMGALRTKFQRRFRHGSLMSLAMANPTIGYRNLQRKLKRWIFPVVLCLIFLAQCAWFVRTQSLTYDEPVDIAGGLEAWRDHRFELYNDHTPLARLLVSLPLLDQRWQIDLQTSSTVGWRVSRISPDPESLAERARAMNVFCGLILAFVLWATARRLFSESAANVALALYVFSPTVIANFSVATTDGAVTVLIFACAAQLLRWRARPSWERTIAMGVLLGLMLLAKFSAPVMFVLAILWMLVLKPQGLAFNPVRWNWTKVAAALAIAFFVVWAGYFFHVSRLTVHDQVLTVSFPHRANVVYKPVRNRMNFSILVPAGEYLEGFRTVVRHNRHGMPAYLFGEASKSGGWRSYYPAVMLLKWPVITLLLFAASLLLLLLGKIPAPRGIWVVASFPAVYLGFAIFSHFDMGDRHILPVYIFVLLFAGSIWEAIRPNPVLVLVAILAISLQAADIMRYAPD